MKAKGQILFVTVVAWSYEGKLRFMRLRPGREGDDVTRVRFVLVFDRFSTEA